MAAKRRRNSPPVRIVDQVRQAVRRGNRLATIIGCIFGGWVPLASYWLAHHEIRASLYGDAFRWPLIVGGLVFSAITVYRWSVATFGLRAKAAGFVVLIEGVMISSTTQWLSISALALLMGINGIATGVALAAKQRTSK